MILWSDKDVKEAARFLAGMVDRSGDTEYVSVDGAKMLFSGPFPDDGKLSVRLLGYPESAVSLDAGDDIEGTLRSLVGRWSEGEAARASDDTQSPLLDGRGFRRQKYEAVWVEWPDLPHMEREFLCEVVWRRPNGRWCSHLFDGDLWEYDPEEALEEACGAEEQQEYGSDAEALIALLSDIGAMYGAAAETFFAEAKNLENELAKEACNGSNERED